MKIPADSKVLRYDTARLRDRRAMARLEAAGEPFSVPAFCAALVAEFDAERPAEQEPWKSPWPKEMV